TTVPLERDLVAGPGLADLALELRDDTLQRPVEGVVPGLCPGGAALAAYRDLHPLPDLAQPRVVLVQEHHFEALDRRRHALYLGELRVDPVDEVVGHLDVPSLDGDLSLHDTDFLRVVRALESLGVE